MRPRLIEERKKHYRTQSAIAKELSITEQHYQRLESGDSDGSVKIWEQLSRKFGVSINDLLSQGHKQYSNTEPAA
jgi:DNA-binding XRE family transcriptional regulator